MAKTLGSRTPPFHFARNRIAIALALERESLDFLQDFIEIWAVEKLPAQDLRADFLRTANVLKRTSVEQNQVGVFPRRDRAKVTAFSQEFSGIARGRLQSFERRQTGLHQKLEFM